MKRYPGDESPEPAVNVCEHGDHPAPEGKRFCSYGCQTCEVNSFGRDGCDGSCERINAAESSSPALPDGTKGAGR